MKLNEVLIQMGFDSGWVASEEQGIVLWERQESQPTEKELIGAGWVKAQPQTKEPTE
jgi:hypothetical protein